MGRRSASGNRRGIGRGRELHYYQAGNFCSLYGWAHLFTDIGSVDLTPTHS